MSLNEELPGWVPVKTPQGVMWKLERAPRAPKPVAKRFARVEVIEVVRKKRRGKRAKVSRVPVVSFAKVSDSELASLRKHYRGEGRHFHFVITQ